MSGPELLDPELERELRAIVPRPEPSFRARLDAQVAAGFPQTPKARRRRLPALRPWLLAPAGALTAAVVAVVLVLGGGDTQAPTVSSAPESARDSAAGGSAVAPQAAAPQATAPGRRVERSARLELGAAAGDFTTVTDGVVRTTQRHGGFVAASQVGRDGAGGTATFVLRIPSGDLDAAIADLSSLGTVRGIEQSTQDLTGSYDATTARLDDARAQRRAIIEALATATGRRAERLRARLETATARVTRLERAQRELRTRTTYATVDLTVVGARAGAAAPSGPWTPGDAWRDARRALEVAAGVLIVIASFAVPIGLLVAIAAWSTGVLRRRRRAAALDQT